VPRKPLAVVWLICSTLFGDRRIVDQAGRECPLSFVRFLFAIRDRCLPIHPSSLLSEGLTAEQRRSRSGVSSLRAVVNRASFASAAMKSSGGSRIWSIRGSPAPLGDSSGRSFFVICSIFPNRARSARSDDVPHGHGPLSLFPLAEERARDRGLPPTAKGAPGLTIPGARPPPDSGARRFSSTRSNVRFS